MNILFGKDNLKELYEKGMCTDRKHWFQPQVVSKYRKTVDLIESTTVMEDLFRFHSLHFESLHGDKEGLYSVRMNDQYRLEFTLGFTGSESVVTVCMLVELSNDYK